MLSVFLLSNLLTIIFMLYSTCTKQVLNTQDNLSAFELAFFRSVYNLVASCLFLHWSEAKISDGYNSQKRWILYMRCISGTVCFTAFVFSIKYLPLSIFFVILNICPFLMALLACLWLREMITVVEVICMLGAFGGILIVGLSRQAESGEDIEEI